MNRKIPIAKNESIPDLAFFKSAFARFKKNAKGDYESVMESFVKEFNSYPILPLHIANKETIESFEAYRIISERDMQSLGLNKTSLASFSHPPVGKCLQQRFNIPGYPALYAASLPHTAIQEKYDTRDFQNGDTFYVSKWELKKNVSMAYIMLFYGEHLDPKHKNVHDTLEIKMDEMFGMYTEEKRKSLKYFLQELSDMSLTESWKDITAALGHYYFYKSQNEVHPPIGFIAYPSVKKKHGENFAINPQLISDGILVCTEVQKQILTDHQMKQSAITLEEVGIVNDENVEWKKFGYRFESAIFFNTNDEPFLNFSGVEMKEGKFNSYSDEKPLTVEEFLYQGLRDDIQKDIVGLAKLNKKFVNKLYNASVPNSIVINQTECKRIEFKMSFQYSES